MGSEVEIWSTGSPLDVFVSLFSSLLLFLLDFSPVQMASARVFTTFRVSQVEGDFSHAPNWLKDHPERCQSVAGHMISYDYVCGMIVYYFLPFSFIFSCTVYAAQEVCA
jgi:hypothetical protein